MKNIRVIAAEPVCVATWHWTVSWTHGRCSTASGRVYGADLELTEEAEWGNTEFLNILI